MVTFTPLICPSCGARLQVALKIGQTMCYCQFCGTPIMIVDENTKTYRNVQVDEAKIHESDVRQNIRLQELQFEERKRIEKRAKGRNLIILGICLIPLFGIGFFIVMDGIMYLTSD